MDGEMVRYVKSKTIIDKATGCWLWFGAGRGSGKQDRPTRKINGKTQLVSRLLMTELYGEIPAGMVVCHTCDRPRCINPAHLWIGTQADNMADMTRKGRNPRSKNFHGRTPRMAVGSMP